MKRKYTFVVGAGASKEFGFPVGDDLVHTISNLLKMRLNDFGGPDGNREIIAELNRLTHPDPSMPLNMDYVYRTANWISSNMGLAASIDNFLDAHQQKVLLPEIGKIAIAHAILEAERKSPLCFDPRKQATNTSFASFPPNWLTTLFRILTTQRDFEQFRVALRSFRFVTFNYDRIIEKFFSDAIQSYYEPDPSTLSEVLSEDLKICHVYGSLGPISGGNGVAFGGLHQHYAAFDGSQNIKTFTEGASDEGEMEKAKEWCNDSHFLLFLGFAFHPLNILALKPNDIYPRKSMFGTCLGMSDDNVSIAKNSIAHSWFDRATVKIDLRKVRGHELLEQLSGRLLESDILS